VTVKSVTFTFQPDASLEEQQRALSEISHWRGVKTAAHLKPGARNAAVARMAYAVLAPDADAADIAANLDKHPSIESASVPSPRYLATE
jgi:hypothetical protein